MKKNILRTTALSLLALISLLFTSCFDPIYNSILNDVKPEKPTVNGDISSIARYTVNGEEYLFLAANGGLRYKEVKDTTHGSWKTYSKLPFGTIHTDNNHEPYLGRSIIKVVSDNNYLYLATVKYKGSYPENPLIFAVKITDFSKEPEIKELKFPENKGPKLITLKEKDTPSFLGGFNIFSTNAVESNNRKAYLRVGDNRAVIDNSSSENKIPESYKTPIYYELNGTSDLQTISTITTNAVHTEFDPDVNGYNSAVIFSNQSTPTFLHTPVSATAEINGKNFIYFAVGKKLYYVEGGNKPELAVELKNDISSIAPTQSSLIIGCGNRIGYAGGIQRVEFRDIDSSTGMGTSGIPKNEVSGFKNNAQIQIPSSYMVPIVFNATPDKKESESTLYAAVTFAGSGINSNNRNENKGLWSYYPNRGNWNRE